MRVLVTGAAGCIGAVRVRRPGHARGRAFDNDRDGRFPEGG
jgi:nucleoside-diphosphate-sugar epimerase